MSYYFILKHKLPNLRGYNHRIKLHRQLWIIFIFLQTSIFKDFQKKQNIGFYVLWFQILYKQIWIIDLFCHLIVVFASLETKIWGEVSGEEWQTEILWISRRRYGWKGNWMLDPDCRKFSPDQRDIFIYWLFCNSNFCSLHLSSRMSSIWHLACNSSVTNK